MERPDIGAVLCFRETERERAFRLLASRSAATAPPEPAPWHDRFERHSSVPSQWGAPPPQINIQYQRYLDTLEMLLGRTAGFS
jgi:hypothetical protein